jgi:hypothetical protein
MTALRARMRPFACAMLLCLAWQSPDARGTDAAAQQRFVQARSAFEAARGGTSGAADIAQEKFRQLLSEEPANPLYLAYYGSTYTLQARESSLPWTKIRLVNKGVELLDQALKLLHATEGTHRISDPADPLETRLVAIATYIALPDALFHRMAVAKRTLNEAMASPVFAQATADLRGHLIYEGALIAREERDTAAERTALTQVIALAPPSIDAAGLRERLAQLP